MIYLKYILVKLYLNVYILILHFLFIFFKESKIIQINMPNQQYRFVHNIFNSFANLIDFYKFFN